MQNDIYVEENISIWGYFGYFCYKVFSVFFIYRLSFGDFYLKIELVVIVYELFIYEIIFLLLGYVIIILLLLVSQV